MDGPAALMDIGDLDQAKLTEATLDGWLSLDHREREVILAKVDRTGGVMMTLINEGSTISVMMNGVVVVSGVARWRLMKEPPRLDA